LLQELFETFYFCRDQKQQFSALAAPAEDHPVLRRMSALATELKIVLPVNSVERANDAYYNSLTMIKSARQPHAAHSLTSGAHNVKMSHPGHRIGQMVRHLSNLSPHSIGVVFAFGCM
jgi:hypothetical protein